MKFPVRPEPRAVPVDDFGQFHCGSPANVRRLSPRSANGNQKGEEGNEETFQEANLRIE